MNRGEAKTVESGRATPIRVLRGVALAVGLLVASAAYLAVVRGEALILDLAQIGARILCF